MKRVVFHFGDVRGDGCISFAPTVDFSGSHLLDIPVFRPYVSARAVVLYGQYRLLVFDSTFATRPNNASWYSMDE